MKRVFIVSSHPLFSEGIENLLRREEGLQIVGREKELDRSIEQIRTLQPDVVIVDSSDSDANRGMIMMRVMKEELRTCVVGLNLNDNKIYVCRGEQRTIEELKDFLESITSENGLPKEPPRAPDTHRQSSVTKDRYGRTLDYLRVSITDRCNLRCVYCMPPQGVPSKPREAILRSEEIARIVEAAVSIGFRTIRLTGGEPLVRRGVVDLVRALTAIPGIEEVAMTTNATVLSSCAGDLARAGLKRINISLDSLQPERFRRITRLGNLESVWRGIEAAEAVGLTPLKINIVVVRGFNDDEVADFARLTLAHPWHVRFIEVMPTTGVSDWGSNMPEVNERLVTVAEIHRRLQDLGPLSPVDEPNGHGPARYYRLPDAQGTVGFISPISEHFCASCNRLRLTADGYLRPCLFSTQGVYIKAALAAGASLVELQSLIRQAGDIKPERRPPFADIAAAGMAMSMIGG
jgi:cyclic pyranopterin phosphate synthase